LCRVSTQDTVIQRNIIILLFLFCPFVILGQIEHSHLYEEEEVLSAPAKLDAEEILEADSLSLPQLDIQLPDSTIHSKYAALPEMENSVDTTRKINYWNITWRTGEIVPARPDTFLTDYFNRTNVEGQSLSMAYLGNLGSPGESRIFFDRADRSHFMFEDVRAAYLRTPENYPFINTKIPHSNVSYQRGGGRLEREERFSALLNSNFGRKLNVGVDLDYLYARGFYQSQSAKHVDWILFGNYLSDRHRVHIFLNTLNATNAENGGIEDDYYISHPEKFDVQGISTRDIPTLLSGGQNSVWNHQRGNRAYLNYHYNLGFERETAAVDSLGEPIMQFIPVSSIIYTSDYKNNQKKFYGSPSLIAEYYQDKTNYFGDEIAEVNDSTHCWTWNNTLALSMREGFSSWAKFALTAFITQDIRSFTMIDETMQMKKHPQSSTYIGGELAKRSGKFLRYHGQGSLGVLGDNLGDMHLSGTVETRIPLWGDTAVIQADAFLKNLAPTFYENHYHSRFFWWDNDFSKVKKVYVGGKITIPHTRTILTLGVENLTNFIYFDKNGLPKQDDGNIQVIAAGIEQNLQFKAIHWDNRLAYQLSSRQEILPLPDLAAYSSFYFQFKIAKVLTVQMGANAHYWTKYYAPSYEPATQQFKLQAEDEKVKVGNFPIISGFLNCHLKQTRFFLEYYNVGAMLISPPEYFSLPHYPVNPPVLKIGLSVDFIN